MRIEEIWRYPVKSTCGERLTHAPVDERGIEFDRAWGIFDPATGLVLTARREPALLFLSSQVVDGAPVITTDDGEDVSSDESLSAHLGRPVELRSAADGPATFENPMNIDDETDWFQWQSAGRSFHDGRSTISFTSRGTMRDWDPRRFRLNVILDGDEAETRSGRAMIGSATITVREPIERCIMVSRAQPGIDRDLEVLKTIIRERDNQLGMGAVVSSPGVISVGDELRT
ncbi:MAG: MOSC N-terminal beta barrel domain-containing protein [Ilumatobacteraceae bacterium]